MNRYFALTVTAVTLLTLPSRALAVSVPDFGSCAAPRGDVIASYDSGTHGVVGNPTTYYGSDAVYRLSDMTVLQCFCAEDGTGIQTNWMRAAELNENDIAVLKSQGWYLVPDGSLWGLSQGPYVAQNISYNCKPGNPGTGGGGGGSSSSSDNGGGIGGGDILSAAAIGGGDVLGLADTGDIWKLYTAFLVAFILLATGSRMLKKSSARS